MTRSSCIAAWVGALVSLATGPAAAHARKTLKSQLEEAVGASDEIVFRAPSRRSATPRRAPEPA